MKLSFAKMQGLGNDFVVIDAVRQKLALTPAQLHHIADRRFGIGCDQILLVEPAPNDETDFFYRIYNSDGSEAEQCGNGARCLARFIRDQSLSKADTLRFQTTEAVIETRDSTGGLVAVNMGTSKLEPFEIPFLAKRKRLRYELECDDRTVEFAAVSMGNPHAVVEVPDVETAEVERWGRCLQESSRFPKGVNVGFMQIDSLSRIRLRVYERGAGETLACGTGACAAVVAGRLWEKLDAAVTVDLKGGQLMIEWRGVGEPVFMTGPAETVFEGSIEL